MSRTPVEKDAIVQDWGSPPLLLYGGREVGRGEVGGLTEV